MQVVTLRTPCHPIHTPSSACMQSYRSIQVNVHRVVVNVHSLILPTLTQHSVVRLDGTFREVSLRRELKTSSLTLCIVTGSLQSTRVGVNLYAEPPPADIPNPRLAIAFTSSSGPGCAARSTVAHLLELHPRQLATRSATLLEDR